ncbi:asparaginase domain-containing protein [Kitasatospora mediocidica]|uniref:asparaginase domain-containing protein n=1 Tax=Kitasatospora mediocidica TaxID=58352 RepID=UPI0006905270|nr:asparaginase domain-containing protein [Kitasatospora mediocidica]
MTQTGPMNATIRSTLVPHLRESGIQLDVADLHDLPHAMTFDQTLDLALEASEAVRTGADGVIVTQGLDALEGAAYLLDLVWPHEEPLVLTGTGPDESANLRTASLVAASPAARGLGVLVVLDDEIHGARALSSAGGTGTASFGSPRSGPVGLVADDQVHVVTAPSRPGPLPLARCAPARVGLHTLGGDDDAPGRLLALAENLDGLVLVGAGANRLPPALAASLDALADRIPVVLATDPELSPEPWSAPGPGLIGARGLHPARARTLLRLLLSTGAQRAAIAEAFRSEQLHRRGPVAFIDSHQQSSGPRATDAAHTGIAEGRTDNDD